MQEEEEELPPPPPPVEMDDPDPAHPFPFNVIPVEGDFSTRRSLQASCLSLAARSIRSSCQSLLPTDNEVRKKSGVMILLVNIFIRHEYILH